MGSAIPSRSFKILQAMTTPENAAEMEGSGVEYEQISPNNYYPYYPYPYPYPYPMATYYIPPVDPNWHYPQFPPVPPCYYYYPEYDSQNCGDNGFYPITIPQPDAVHKETKSLNAPNIIVTPTPDDDHLNQENSIQQNDREKEETALDMLSKKLNQINVKPELDMNLSKDDKKYVGDTRKDLIDPSSPVNNERPSEIEDNSNDGNNSDEDILSSSSSSEAAVIKPKRISSSNSKDGLQAIKSVTNIKVYNTDEEGNTNNQDETAKTGTRCDEESDTSSSSSSSSDSSMDNKECEVVNSDSDEGDDLTEDEVAVQEVLSVIYEESEADAANRVRRESHASTGSTLSDCSTTIANDGLDTEDDSVKEEITKEDCESNLVTVRLPLKLSFSRSSNDENITTVVVGDSEIEDDTSLSKSKDDLLCNNNDISVTFKLSSTRSGSFDNSCKITPSTSADRVAWADENADSDSEVSVSVSFPMKRDKFVAQTLSGDLINNISEINSDLESDSSECTTESSKSSKYFPDEGKWLSESDDKKKEGNDDGANISDSHTAWDWGEQIRETWNWNPFSTKYEEENMNSKLEGIHEEAEGEETENSENNEETKTDGEKIDEGKCKEEQIYVPYKVNKNLIEKLSENSLEAILEGNDLNDEVKKNYKNEQETNERKSIYYNEKGNNNKKYVQEDRYKANYGKEEMEEEEEQEIEGEEVDTKEAEEENVEGEEVEEKEVDIEKVERGKLEKEEEGEEDEEEEVEEEEEEEDEEEETKNKEEEDKEEEEEAVKSEQESLSTDSEDSENEVDNVTPTNIYPNYKKCEGVIEAAQSPFNFSENNQEQGDKSCISNKTPDENEIKISVRDRIAIFEAAAVESPIPELKKTQNCAEITINNTSEKKKVLSRNSSLQKSESEFEEDDSGVTDMSKPISETDTESESFPELRKMTRYQRAATHSRLFKLLQEESSFDDSSDEKKEEVSAPTFHSRKKIVHNVSITRKTNPDALKNAETMSQRRERLSLPLKKTNSIDADNLSTSNSPSSPTASSIISDKLVNELVQSLLLKKKSHYLRNLPMDKLQAAAKRVLEEELDSLENTSLESTPALTPQEFKSDGPSSYADYYETWNSKASDSNETDYDILPSKAFRTLQEQSISGRRKPWAARCPRVLSSKTINRDLARVTESPETYRSSSVTRNTQEKHPEFTRGRSLGV